MFPSQAANLGSRSGLLAGPALLRVRPIMPCLDPSIIFSSKGNKISGFEINQERVSLGILGDFRIMMWKPGKHAAKSLESH